MSGWSVYQYTESQMTSLANQAKEQLLFALANEGLLKGDPHEIAHQYVIVLYQRGWFGSLWDRFRRIHEREGLFFAVLKSVNSGVPMDDEEREPHLKVVPLHRKEEEQE